MRLTKKELTKELQTLEDRPVYEVVFTRTYSVNRVTRRLAVNNEIDAARVVREQFSCVDTIFSVTLVENQRVWA